MITYSFWETVLNSGEFKSENVSGKNTLRFQDPIQVYTWRIAPTHVQAPTSIPSHAQESSETVTTQLLDTSTTDNLPIALQKENVHVLSTQFPILSLFSFIIYLSFIYIFFELMPSFQECVRSTIYYKLDSGIRRWLP